MGNLKLFGFLRKIKSEAKEVDLLFFINSLMFTGKLEELDESNETVTILKPTSKGISLGKRLTIKLDSISAWGEREKKEARAISIRR